MLLTIEDVIAYLKMSRAHLYTLMNEEKFPRGIKIGKSIRWRQATVEAWIDSMDPAKKSAAQDLEAA
jgi:predicted DNA-binding transcriptional regulator AlpA